ncbi:E3 SUMO-protein ligase NSE2 [Carlito syrichta]|uniref:E3 SUMO-protein ligase NSE2 n=1 Tax=Carlito syrichta TaxID=1868482 RepID=A0A3Q0DRB5_CARSF|nr:E3 SUMO-protein ligase NSE2 [Carlito syrichta]
MARTGGVHEAVESKGLCSDECVCYLVKCPASGMQLSADEGSACGETKGPQRSASALALIGKILEKDIVAEIIDSRAKQKDACCLWPREWHYTEQGVTDSSARWNCCWINSVLRENGQSAARAYYPPEVSSECSMDKAMLEFAIMDRQLNHYIKAVQSAINHVKEERPENIPDLKLLVEKKFLALQSKNSDADFQNNEKFVQYKQQLKELKKQCGLPADREADAPGVDEDMIVTQSQMNLVCPITQLEMKKPVRNKVCGHTYEEEAILRMIQARHKRKKKACCPKIGCSHTDMRRSDLIQDEALRRAIENHHKRRQRHSE